MFGFFVQASPAKLGTSQRSAVFEFLVQESPTKLGTHLVVISCYVSSMCYQVAPCYSDQGADLRQHVWGLDTYMTDDVGKLSDSFFDPGTR